MIGWEPIVNKEVFQNFKYNIFKVPHHGSSNGYNSKDWQCFLAENKVLKLTPYSRGKFLPDDLMIKNLQKYLPNCFITYKLRYKKLSHNIRKKVKDLDLKILANDSGYIKVQIDEAGMLNVMLYNNASQI